MNALLIILLLGLAGRGLTLIPEVIDIDEAWFAASAHKLTGPFSFFRQAPDNKPPGTVWFYWVIENISGISLEPRLARAGAVAWTLLGAWLLGILCTRIEKKIVTKRLVKRFGLSQRGLLASVIYTLCLACCTPELFAVTNELLMLPFIIGAVLCIEESGFWPESWAFLCGLCLSVLPLLKQTGVFFWPLSGLILFHSKNTRHFLGVAWSLFLGLFIIPAIAFYGLGIDDSVYWLFTYPGTVLTEARESYFELNSQFGMNSLRWIGALLPVGFALFSSRHVVRALPSPVRYMISGWLVLALGSVAMGHGLFLHYFLFFIPPIALAAALIISEWKFPVYWLATAHTVMALIAAIPHFGGVWGTDLLYYREVSKVLKSITSEKDEVFLWSGNTLAAVLAERTTATRFATARFSTIPYASDATKNMFRHDFESRPPRVIVDLHERGDSRFNVPLSAEPWLSAMIRKHYTVYRKSIIPWVVFYIKNEQGARSERNLAFDKSHSADEKVIQALAQLPYDFRHLSKVLKYESAARALHALSMLNQNTKTREYEVVLNRALLGQIEQSHVDEAIEWVALQYSKQGKALAYALQSPWWWVSFSTVQLQPVTIKRDILVRHTL